MNWKKGTALVFAGVMASSVLLAGCGKSIDKNAVAATLGDKEISLGLANFMAQYQAITYDSLFLGSYGEKMWSQDVFGSGSTMTESVKSSVMEQLELDYLLEQHMEEYNVEITDEEMADIKAAAQQFMSDNTEKAIKATGAEEEYVTEMLRLIRLASKMENAIKAEADTEVSDDEAAQKTFSYIQIKTDSHKDADGNTIDYTEEEKTQLAKTAEAVAEAAATDFEAAATDNGYEVQTYSYGSDEDNSTMDVVATDAADKLKEGEVSGLLTAEDGTYYIVRLDSEFDQEATDKKKEEIVKQRQTDYYNQKKEEYLKDADWTVKEDVWKTVNFDELYTIKQEDSTEAVSSTEK